MRSIQQVDFISTRTNPWETFIPNGIHNKFNLLHLGLT